MEERAGANVYRFTRNQPNGRRDRLGLWCDGPVTVTRKEFAVVGSYRERYLAEDWLGRWRYFTRTALVDTDVDYEVRLIGPTVQGEWDDSEIFVGAVHSWRPPRPAELGFGTDENLNRIDLSGVACRVTERCTRECSRCRTVFSLFSLSTAYTQVGCVWGKEQYRYGIKAMGMGGHYCQLLAEGQGVSISGETYRQNPPLTCDETDVPKCSGAKVDRCHRKYARWSPP